MEPNNNIEKAYDLIEQYDFLDLSDEDKNFILSVMSEVQYIEVRRAISDVKVTLHDDIQPILNNNRIPNYSESNKFMQIINYPIQLYKIAASIAIIIAAYLIIQKSNQNIKSQLTANHSTITIHQTDTVYSKVFDTIKIVENKVLTLQTGLKQVTNQGLIAHSKQIMDCNRELCPNEVGKIITLNHKNTISSDSTLNGLLLALN